MARYRYVGYSKRRQRKRKQIYVGASVTVVIIMIILLSLSGEDSQPQGQIPQSNAEQTTAQQNEIPLNVPKVEAAVEKSLPAKPSENAADAKAHANVIIGSSEEAAGIVAEAKQDMANGNIVAARDKLNDALRMPQINASEKQALKEMLSALSEQWLFTKNIYPKDSLCSLYKVSPGDRLSEIGKKYKVPYQILMAINGIKKAESLRAGENIKVITGPFHAIVYRSSYTIDIFLQHTYVRSYNVGLGKSGRDTPTGLWRVKKGGKLVSPPWTDPDTGKHYESQDPDYPLGSRWIGLEGVEGNAKGRTGFAIHGTKDSDTIGTRSSRGCIRLYNGDVVPVYNMLAEELSGVRVEE